MKINITHIAKLANIPISSDEEKKLEQELESTLVQVGRLEEIATENIIPTFQVTGLENIWRDDEITLSLTQEEALRNAKKTYNGFFVVPAILENK